MLRASSPSRALGLFVAAAVALDPGLAPAAPAPTGDPPPRAPKEDPTDAPPPAPISTEAAGMREPPPPSTPLPGKALQPDPPANPPAQPPVVAPPNNVAPLTPTAGMGGRLMSADDPEARRAKAELEGTSLSDKPNADVPARLPPLQRGAWWSMFGAFAIGSAGGVFAGLAEVQEDKATRLAITLDGMTGAQLVYTDVQAEYDDILRVGRRDAAVARGLLSASAGFLVAGAVLFIVHAVRARKAARSRPAPSPTPPAATPTAARRFTVDPARGGLEVRF